MKEEEFKVYVINPEDERVSDISNIRDLHDDEFIFESKEQGLVYSIKGFEEAFNNEEILDSWFIRII
jgi:hypothetical protein